MDVTGAGLHLLESGVEQCLALVDTERLGPHAGLALEPKTLAPHLLVFDQRAPGAGKTLDRHAPAPARDELVHHRGVVAGVDACEVHRLRKLALPFEQHGEVVPHLGASGVAGQDHVLEQPRLLAFAPRNDAHLEAVFLHVHAGGDERVERASVLGERVEGVFLQPADEADLFDAVAPLAPHLAEVGIDEALELGGVALAVDPLLRDRAPVQAEAGGRVQGVEVVAVGELDAGALRHPSTAGEHVGLVAFADLGAAVLAHVPGVDHLRQVVRVVLGRGRGAPLEAVLPCLAAELQVLELVAVRARHVVAAHVGAAVLDVDAALPFERGRAHQVGLGA